MDWPVKKQAADYKCKQWEKLQNIKNIGMKSIKLPCSKETLKRETCQMGNEEVHENSHV